MSAMIQNDKEKEWMLPLLKIRNELDFRTESARALEKERRDFRRMGGHLQYYHEKNGDIQLIRGPYTQKARAHWLKRLLETQRKIHSDPSAPAHIKSWKLISIEELEEIRRIWLVDKHEVEDLVPKIYTQVLGEEYPGGQSSSSDLFDDSILELLRAACGDNIVRYETARNLLVIEQKYQKMGARRGLFADLEQTIKNGCFENEQEALAFKKKEASIGKMTADEFSEVSDISTS
jgi:DNA sulfur modification protein DndC